MSERIERLSYTFGLEFVVEKHLTEEVSGQARVHVRVESSGDYIGDVFLKTDGNPDMDDPILTWDYTVYIGSDPVDSGSFSASWECDMAELVSDELGDLLSDDLEGSMSHKLAGYHYELASDRGYCDTPDSDFWALGN